MSEISRNQLFDCTGMSVVITGGGTGIGLTMASALASNGAHVFILGRRLSKLQEAASTIASSQPTGRVVPVECDISNRESLAKAAAQVESAVGFVNLFIANAGIMGAPHKDMAPRAADDARAPITVSDVQESIWRADPEDFLDVFRVNVAGVLYSANAFLGLLDQGNRRGNVRQTSQILVTTSIAAYARTWEHTGIAYLTSKAATTHLVKILSKTLLPLKIRVNAISPGIFPSEMATAALGDADLTKDGSLPLALQPMGRGGRPGEMGGTVLYYASEAGGYCTGSVHVIDGGRLGITEGSTY